MKFYGLIGEKLGHSWSGPIHEIFFRETGISGAYKLTEVPQDEIGGVIPAMKLMGISGMNVTIPYKKQLIPYLDEIDPMAARVGAVNTLKLKDGRVSGHNSDVFGLMRSLEAMDIDISGGVCAILGGTGGVTAAAAEVMRQAGVKKLYLVSRRPHDPNDKPLECAEWLTYDQLPDIRGALMINGTPVGMYPNCDATPVSPDIVKNFDAVLDTIYNPLPTLLLRHAQAAGKRAKDGFYMLVAQAIRSQDIWQEQSYGRELIDLIYNELKPKLEGHAQ